MRVLTVVRTLKMGGMERVAVNLADALADAGHESHLMYFKGRKKSLAPENPAVRVHFFDVSAAARLTGIGLLLELAARLLNAIIRKSYFIPSGAFGGWLFARRLRKLERELGSFDRIIFRGFGTFEMVWSFRDPRGLYVLENILRSDRRWLERAQARLLLDGRKLVAVSSGVKQSVERAQGVLGFAPASLRVITNPCPVDRIRQLMLEPCDEIPDRPYLINVARMVPQKNHALLLEAYARSRRAMPLVLVGDGPLRSELEARAKALGIGDEVVFAGARVNPYPWMRGASLFVLSSRFEGLGIVLLEALACATPIISVDCPGGVRDVFHGPLEPYLCENTPDALAALIDRTLQAGTYRVDEAWLQPFRPETVIAQFLAPA